MERASEIIPLVLVLFSLRNTLPMLRSFFSFDDLQNLAYYLHRPWTSIFSNLLTFTSLRRPAGSAPYLLNFLVFGLNPLPLYLLSFAVFYANLLLLYLLARRWFGGKWMPALAAGLWSLHPQLHNVLFNFGAIYELLCCTGILAGLLSYSTFRRSGSKFWLAAAFAGYWLALNSKETAVVFPALVLTYEILFPDHRVAWLRRLIPTALFGLIAIPYSLAKTLGSEAFWRENPQYRYQFDWTPVQNLASYLFELTYGRIQFSIAMTAAILVGAFLLGILFRNRAMIFGMLLAGFTLAPILFLPRVWGLFLYIPLAGVSLYVAALLVETGRFLESLAAPKIRVWLNEILPRDARPGPAWHAAVSRIYHHPLARTLAMLLLLTVVFRPAFRFSVRETRYARDQHYHLRGQDWRSFLEQLRALQPSARPDAVFGFENPPFDPATDDHWCLYFLVWLNYGSRDIQIFRLPESREAFDRAARKATESQSFSWQDGRLERRTDR